MFVQGDTVVYPQHGAAFVDSVVEREVFGEARTYLKLRVTRGDLTILVPTDAAEQVGVREVACRSEVDAVFDVLRQAEGPMPDLWTHRFKANLEKLVTGDIHLGAEVIRDLSLRERRQRLSPAEKRVLLKARAILISELSVALGWTEERAEASIDEALGEVRRPNPDAVSGPVVSDEPSESLPTG